jgi:hypothetical protein
METIRPPYSEVDALLCLKQSAILLDYILARARRADNGLPLDAWHAIATQNLNTISHVLCFLAEHIIPSLVSGGHGIDAFRQHVMRQLLTLIGNQISELELHLKAPPTALN